jgi:hypothetical protein
MKRSFSELLVLKTKDNPVLNKSYLLMDASIVLLFVRK